MRALLFCGAGLVASCTEPLDLGYAVALTMQFDDSVSNAALSEIDKIQMTVSQESYSDDILLGRPAMRTERVIYRPKAGSTSLTFDLTATNDAGVAIATGTVSVSLKPNATVTAEVILRAIGTSPDGGMLDGAIPDGAHNADGGDGGSVAISFVTTPLIGTAHDPISIGIADFNGDKNNDIAVATSGGTVEVFFGHTDHSFAQPPDVTDTTSAAPGVMAVGNFGGDALPDLVVADRSTNMLHFLINKAGAFTAMYAEPTMIGADNISIGDFDKDGLADVALASSTTAQIELYIQGSTPPFSEHITIPTPSGVLRVHATDFNADGFSDLIYAEVGDNEVGLRMNVEGDLSSGSETQFAFPTPYDVVTYDFANSNGKPQAVIFGLGNDGDGLLLNNDNGTLALDSNVLFNTHDLLGNWLHYARALDFEGNSMPDIISTHYTATNGVYNTDPEFVELTRMVMLNELTFGTPTSYVSGEGPDAFDVGDLDGDGLLDIAVANRGSDTIGLMKQLAGGKLFAAPTIGVYAGAPAIGDFNGDGSPDFLTAGGNISLWANDGLGNFPKMAVVTANAHCVAVGDMNEDKLPDVVWGQVAMGYSTLDVALASTAGVFGAQLSTPGLFNGDFTGMLVQDIDGDKHLDVVFVTQVGAGDASGQNVLLLLGHGNGTFAAPLYYPAAGAIAVAVADIDEDGQLDVLVLSSSSSQVVWLRGDSHTLVAGPSIATPVSNGTGFALFDANSDGHTDILIGGDSVHVLLGNGKGAFTDAGATFSAATTQAVAVGDLDGDGVPEVMAATSESLIRVFHRSGMSYVAAGEFAAGSQLSQLFAAKFANDQRTHLIAAGNQVAFLRNDTP